MEDLECFAHLRVMHVRGLHRRSCFFSFACHTEASASFIPYLASASNGTYTYNLVFNTTGATSSSNPSPELLVRGDFISFYDIAVPGTILDVTAPNSEMTVTTQTLGQTSPGLSGAAGVVDDPALLNLTVIFFGSFLDHNAAISGLSITIAGGANQTRPGIFTSVDKLQANGANLDQLGPVPLPALVPEPAALGLGALLLCLAGRRRWDEPAPRRWETCPAAG